MDENQSKLRIFFYGKNALDDLQQICKDADMNLAEDNKFKYKIRVANDKQNNYQYFIITGEISKERNEVIKQYLELDYKNENMLLANELISKKRDELKKDYGLDDKKLNELTEKEDQSLEISYSLFQESLSKEMTKILTEYRQFYDILVICVDSLSGEDSKEAFKFFQGFTKIRGEQPFLFFLTKKEDNPDITSLFKFVTNEFFDKRNVFAYKFPSNDEEKEKICNHFVKCKNYYHEEGTNDLNNDSQTFNILICGRAGVGKSSFINQFLNEKIAKEGEGLSVTHEISNYKHPKYKLKIFDTPGFENDETVENVYRTIRKFEKDIRDSKNHLDLIIYFNDLSKRNFYALETKLIKHIISQKKKLIFVMNDHSRNPLKERKRLMEIVGDSIKKIINTMENKDEIDTNEILKNMIVINLKQSIEEDEDDEENNSKIRIKQTFGMDELFKMIYEMLKKHKILIYEIEQTKNAKEIKKYLNKYDLLRHIESIEDIHVNIKITCANLILSYAKYDFFVWFFIDSRRKELLQKINAENKGDKDEDYDLLLSNIKAEVEKLKDKKKVIKEFFESMSKFKGYFATQGFNFDAYFYNETTLLIGLQYFKRFKNDYGEYDEKSQNYLKELCNSLNAAIENFNELSIEWDSVYKSLKAHKTEIEWVKKFFIVEEPKTIDK